MLSKCKNCICYDCKTQFGTIPTECPMSDCPWCIDDSNCKGHNGCNEYLNKGGTYGRKAK